MKENINRIEWTDIAKGIGIILVIIGHVSGDNYIKNFIYAFHMPLFFIISGYLYKPKNNFIKHKAKTILIPYLIISIISFIYWVTIERFIILEKNIDPLKSFINIFLAIGNTELYAYNVVLWFLPCLFVTEIIFNFLINKFSNKHVKIIIFISSVIGFIFPRITNISLPFCIDIAFTAIVFYYIGYLMKDKLNKKISLFSDNIVYYSTLVILIFYVAGLSIIENGANMMTLKYKYYLLFYTTAILGFCMIYMISNKINSKFLKWIGKNSLYVMVIHEPIKRIIIELYAKAINKDPYILGHNLVSIIIISISVLAITLMGVAIIDILRSKLHDKKYKKNGE